MMLQNVCIRYDKTLKQKPSTTSRAVYQHEVDEDPSVHDEEDDYLDENFAPDGMDTHSDDIYHIHNTNFNMTPHMKSLIPRTHSGKPRSNKAVPPKPGYNGSVYLPKHICNMLSDNVKKNLDKYNQKKKAIYRSAHPWMAKVHEQDHDKADHPDNPEPIGIPSWL